MPKDLVFEGLRIDHQMTFEKLLPQLSQESARRISKWWYNLPGDYRELVDQLIDLAYVTGEENTKAEAFNLLAQWMERGKHEH